MTRPASTITRRAVLGGLVLGGPLVLFACAEGSGPVARSGPATDDPVPPTTPVSLSPDTEIVAYGNGPRRFGYLDVPVGAPPPDGWPVAVLVHGGFWRTGFELALMFDLAQSLNNDGWATWNVEYSAVGDEDGGWPGTAFDIASAIDHLAEIDEPRLDLSRVSAIGHSAGAQLALWAAGRPDLPDAADDPPAVPITAVVSLAGVTDLVTCVDDDLGGRACLDFMGAHPREDLGRYLLASPIERLPSGVPTVLIHGDRDLVVPADQTRRYAERAGAAGELPTVEIVPDADHFDPINPGHEAWQQARAWLAELSR